MIPLFATRPAIERLLPAVLEQQAAVVRSGRYVLGPELEAFETEYATAVERRYCIGVGNGTDALTIALRALGIGAGDEVVVPAFTFFATAEAVVNAGAVPVFCDIHPETQCMTAETASAAIGERTSALMPVHLFGNPAPMDELSRLAERHGLALIADAAQAAGARLDDQAAGAYGDVATFSFYPGKNLGALGDGGAIVTDDEDVASTAKQLRNHGTSEQWVHAAAGFNSRLDEIQAASLRVLLPQLDDWTRRRREAAARYGELGLGELVEVPTETPTGESAYHLFVVLTERRDQLVNTLRTDGVEARAYYTTPMHDQPAFAHLRDGERRPASELLASDGLALPMGPCLDEKSVEKVVETVRRNVTGSDTDR